MARISVLNGVNLGTLGKRRPEVYGPATLADVEAGLRAGFPGTDFSFRQTDHEGEMVGFIREAGRLSDGLIVNPGAWSHYAYALHDALEAVEVPKVEVHISNVHAREPWRGRSVVSPAVDAVVAGMGVHGYTAAAGYLLAKVQPEA